MSQLLDDLKAIRDLLSVRERWTKGHHARDASGEFALVDSNFATCWCLDGAALRETRLEPKRYLVVVRSLERAIGGGGYIAWNDAPNRTHADILALLDKAIAAEESRS